MNLTASFDPPHLIAQGFTLLELLMTMTVAAILAAVAIPAFNTFVANDRDSTQVNSLVYSLDYARSEAVKRNNPAGIEVCPSTDSLTCNPAAAWSQGWIVLDLNAADPPPLVLQAVPKLAGNTVSAAGAGATGIVFNSMGAPQAAATLTVTVCDPRGPAYARDVEVSVMGTTQASQKPGFQVDGVTPLTCP